MAFRFYFIGILLSFSLISCGTDTENQRLSKQYASEDAITDSNQEKELESESTFSDGAADVADSNLEENLESSTTNDQQIADMQNSDNTSNLEPSETNTLDRMESGLESPDPASDRLLSKSILDELEANLKGQTSLGLVSTSFLNPADIQIILDGAANAIQDAALLQSNNLFELLPTILSGAMQVVQDIGQLNETFRSDLVAKIVGSIISSIKDRENFIPPQNLGDPNSSPLEALLQRISEVALKGLQDAGFDTQNLVNVVENIMKTIVSSADLAGTSPEVLNKVIKAATEGAIQGASQIERDGFTLEDIGNLSKAIASGATQGIADLKQKNYQLKDLPLAVEDIINGLTQGLDQIVMDFGGKGVLGDILKLIVGGVSQSLEKVKATNEELKKVGEMILQITDRANVPREEMQLGDILTEATGLAKVIGDLIELFK